MYPPNQPYQPPANPPKPPSRFRRFTNWYGRQRRFAQIGLGCGTLIVALLLCAAFGGALQALGYTAPTPTASQANATTTTATDSTLPTATPTRATSLPTATAKPTRPVATATTRPTPTATNPPIPTPTGTLAVSSGPALLGSDISTFNATYGTPNGHSQPSSGLYHYQTYPGQNIDFLIVLTDGSDAGYTTRVESISVQAPEGGWSMTLASAKCAVFLPRDAVHKSDVAVANGPALDKIYFSQSLAGQFPADAFTDAAQNPVKAGYFDVQYLYTDASESHVVGCTVQVGEQQTQ